MLKIKQEHRCKLLDCAIALFGEHGYHTTTVPMIVEASGSSTGSFYFYFRNKEDVFAAALQQFGERVAYGLNAAMTVAGNNPLQQVRAVVECFFILLAENPSEARILIVESSGLGDRLGALRRKIVDSHARSVEQAISAVKKSVEPADADVLAHCCVGSVYESVRHWLEMPPERRPPSATMAEAVADFILRGLGAFGQHTN